MVLQGVAALAFAVSDTFADVDLWWHLRIGEDAWRRGLPRADVYSYLSGPPPYMNHEWLAEAFLSGAFLLAGDAGLVLLKLVLIGTAAWLIGRHVRSHGASVLAATLATVFCVLLFLPGLGTVRPQLFSYLLFTMALLVLSRADMRPRLAWWLPVIVAAWINLHGAVLAGLACILAWVVTERITRQPRGRRVPVLVAVLCVAALACNPWGLRLPWFLRDALRGRPELTEWNPIEVMGVEGVLFGAAALLAGIAVLARPRRVRWPAMVVLAATALAPLIARRHLPFFVIAVAVLAVPATIDAVWRWVAAHWPRAVPRADAPPWHRWVSLLLIAEAVVLLALTVPRISCIRVETEQYPIGAVTLLRASGVSGRMATFFDWGGFVLDALGPRILVSMDPRRETVYAPDVYALNEGLTLGLGDWDALLDHQPVPDLALVSKAFPTFNLMRTRAGWSLVYEDHLSGLFVRDASGLGPALRRATPGSLPSGICFSVARAKLSAHAGADPGRAE